MKKEYLQDQKPVPWLSLTLISAGSVLMLWDMFTVISSGNGF